MIATKILLVEDSQTCLIQLGRIIAGLPGCEVIGTASDGAAGVKQYKLLKPDIVVMDVMMPVMDGIEAILEIVDYDPTARIVVLTSLADSTDILHGALKAGAVNVLRKPVQPGELARALGRFGTGP